MAEAIISRGTSAPIDFVQLTDTEGRIVLLPAAMCDHLRSAGQASVTMTISLVTGQAPREWLSVTEAARKMADDLSISLDSAKVRVSKACSCDQIIHRGVGHSRRIEPSSFEAWLLRARDRANERDEARNG